MKFNKRKFALHFLLATANYLCHDYYWKSCIEEGYLKKKTILDIKYPRCSSAVREGFPWVSEIPAELWRVSWRWPGKEGTPGREKNIYKDPGSRRRKQLNTAPRLEQSHQRGRATSWDPRGQQGPCDWNGIWLDCEKSQNKWLKLDHILFLSPIRKAQR